MDTVYTSAAADPTIKRKLVAPMRVSERDALAISYAILQARIDRVKEDGGEVVKRRGKKRRTSEQKLERLNQQEDTLKKKLEVLQLEKSESFKMFRKAMAAEDAEKLARRAAKEAAAAAAAAVAAAQAAAAAARGGQPPPPPKTGWNPQAGGSSQGGGSIMNNMYRKRERRPQPHPYPNGDRAGQPSMFGRGPTSAGQQVPPRGWGDRR